MGKRNADLITYKRLLSYVVPYWFKMLVAVVLMLAVAGATTALAWLTKPALDNILLAKEMSKLYLLPLGIITIYLTRGICDIGRYYLMADVGQRIIMQIRSEIYNHTQRLSMKFFIKTPTGMLISRITNDVNLVQGAVTSAVTGLIRESFQMVGFIFVILSMNWRLGLIALIVFPIIFYPISAFGKKLKHFSTRSMNVMAGIITLMDETISGIRIVKAYNMEDYETKRFDVENKRYYRNWMRRIAIRAVSTPMLEVVAGAAFAFILWYGGRDVIIGQMTMGELSAFLVALGLLYSPIRRFNEINIQIQEGIAAAKRVFDLMDTVPEITDKTDAVSLERFQDRIEYRDVRFRYNVDDEAEAIRGLSLKIAKGQQVAFVGESGSGKSTIVNLLPRLFDVTAGAIMIDGHDVRDVTMASLRANIAMVTQEMILFNDTIRSNIAYGADDISEEKIIQAAKAANAHDFIMQMSEGYDTKVGESGVRLSGGQRQRICIARAIMKDAPILILDEATSALDTRSEKEVQAAIEKLMSGRTSLVVAHRLSTIVNSDRIIVLDRGEIVESGTHSELLAKDGYHAQLYRLQAGNA